MPDVSQISPPMRIVLAVAVAFLAVYLVALRPKAAVTPPPAPTPAGNVNTGKPAVTGLGKAVQAAKGAAATTEAEQKAEGGDAGATGTTPATGSTATATAHKPAPRPAAAKPAFKGPKVDTAGLPKPVARAIHRHEVLALLFSNRTSPDDRAVQAALRDVRRDTKGLYAHVAPIRTISRYAPITRGADVQQSPTVVVVDRRMKATVLVGYVDSLTIRQAVVDAMRASGGLFASSYLKQVNNSCSSEAHDIGALPQATTMPQLRTAAHRISGRFDRFVAGFRSLPAARGFAAFKRASLTDLVAMRSANHALLRSIGSHPTLAKVLSADRHLLDDGIPAAKRFSKRADRHGLTYCTDLH
jgi:hypothetical protein